MVGATGFEPQGYYKQHFTELKYSVFFGHFTNPVNFGSAQF